MPTVSAPAYPYRAIGKLTFSAGYCSASLIRKSVIVTAAHCIQNFGSGSNLFTNFAFHPAITAPRAQQPRKSLPMDVELDHIGAPSELGRWNRHRHRRGQG